MIAFSQSVKSHFHKSVKSHFNFTVSCSSFTCMSVQILTLRYFCWNQRSEVGALSGSSSMESCRYCPFSSPRIDPAQTEFLLQPRHKVSGTLGTANTRRRFFSIASTTRMDSAEATSAFSYKNFVQFALDETGKYTHLEPSPSQEIFGCLATMDGKGELQMNSFESPKIRLLRSLSIEGSDGMQVLDFAIFPRSEFDLPIFCANFFMTATTSIVVLDLNPLHDVIVRQDYKEKYYRHLIPLGLEYTDLLPWAGKITAESINFFSPIVIWTKFSPSSDKQQVLYSAFKAYLKAWLLLMDQAAEETDTSSIKLNLQAQHRYLTWRAEKDPGHQLLRRLVGDTLSKEIIRYFLFNGVDDMGSKTFTDYFPEYRCDDGTINRKRSIIGKSFELRPWDTSGEFIGDSL